MQTPSIPQQPASLLARLEPFTLAFLGLGSVLCGAAWFLTFSMLKEYMVVGAIVALVQILLVGFTALRSQWRDLGDVHIWVGLSLMVLTMLFGRQSAPQITASYRYLSVPGGLLLMLGGYLVHVQGLADYLPLRERYQRARGIFARMGGLPEKEYDALQAQVATWLKDHPRGEGEGNGNPQS